MGIQQPEREVWKSNVGFVLAAIGSAVGLGNIWRFPFVAHQNGGGAFLIPYFVALFAVGIPLLMLEFGLGHKMRQAFPQALARIDPRFAWIGWWAVTFVMFGIVIYYAVVIAWCGLYLLYSVGLSWGADPRTFFFQRVLHLTESPYLATPGGGEFVFGQVSWAVVIALAGVWAINWFIAFHGVQRGIELANKIFMPLLLVLTTILVVWSWTFEGSGEGRRLYLTATWEKVFDPNVWVAAFAQIFFSLSLGFGIMVAYASYLPPRADIPRYALITALGDGLFAVFAGFAVFSTIGFIAHQTGQPAEAFSGGPGLVFVTYPTAINQIAADAGHVAGATFGVIFFLALVMAGLSSSISILQAFAAAVTDRLGVSHRPVVTVLCALAFVLGIVFCTGSGLHWLDVVDHFITAYGLVTVAILEALIVGWVYSANRLRKHLDELSQFRFRRGTEFLMRLLITGVLAVTWYGLTDPDLIARSPIATGLARYALVGVILLLWLDEHWFDFDIRFLIPGLLVFLLDQALLADLTPAEPGTNAYYGGYPGQVVFGVGASWLVLTLIAGLILSRVFAEPETRGVEAGASAG